MADPSSRRQNQRVSCDLPATLHTPSTGVLIGPARLTDLALEGAAVELPTLLARRLPYELRWDWAGRPFSVTARVAWEKRADGRHPAHRYGLSFATTSEQEDQLRGMVDALRQRLWSNRGPR